jgi:hypothetical protein
LWVVAGKDRGRGFSRGIKIVCAGTQKQRSEKGEDFFEDGGGDRVWVDIAGPGSGGIRLEFFYYELWGKSRTK